MEAGISSWLHWPSVQLLLFRLEVYTLYFRCRFYDINVTRVAKKFERLVEKPTTCVVICPRVSYNTFQGDIEE